MGGDSGHLRSMLSSLSWQVTLRLCMAAALSAMPCRVQLLDDNSEELGPARDAYLQELL